MNNTPIEIDMKSYQSSSTILQVGYKDKTLRIKFKGGSLYDYTDVPEKVYKQMIEADSLGKYLFKNIKGKFKYKKISLDESEVKNQIQR